MTNIALNAGKDLSSAVLLQEHMEDTTPPIFRQYLRIAIRWRYIILGAVAACFLISLIATLLMTPQYTASATIEISRESDQVTDLQGVERETGFSDQEFYQTQYGLLQSRALSERVATQLKLTENEQFFDMFDVKSDDPAFVLKNGRYPAAGRATRQRIAGEILREHLNVSPTRMSRLVEINFTSPDATFSTKVSNAWAENFIQTNLERKIQATSYGRNLLQQQLVQLKQRLDESERQLVDYASSAKIINLPAQSGNGGSSSERSIVVDDLAALNTALSQATASRIEAQARYQQNGRAGASAEALNNSAINSLRQRRAELAAEYNRLMTQFEPGYPAAQAIQAQITQLDRSISSEEGRVTSSLLADYRRTQDQEQALQAKVEQLKGEYLDLRRRSIQYNIYQQEVDTNQVLYDGLLQRFKEIGVAGGVGVNNISIVDPAQTPKQPSSPNLLLNLAIALLIGFGLGAALAFILEQIDEGISDPEEAKRELGLPLLGSVPKIEAAPKDTLLDRKSDLVDAYLTVQTNLAFSTDHGVPRSFAVTSTRPSEGKSTTSLALATTLARSGKRVILIDGDMRNPSVHHLGEVGHDRGLSNYLTGDDRIESLTFQMDKLGFTAMSAGPLPPNAAELLIGNRLTQLIERLHESYDHVIIDCPPVMGLADALLIGGKVEGLVYAVESNGIRTNLVKQALARLMSANVRVIGIVLNKFDAKKAHHGYSYGYEYGYDYGRKPNADTV
jgi:succinoglycan biosynthesis transport protein ExoP